MIKIAVLDDYQNIFEEFIDVDKYKDKFEFTIFNEPFQSEAEAIVALEKFEALFIMRERTPLTKSLLEGLKKKEGKIINVSKFVSYILFSIRGAFYFSLERLIISRNFKTG